MIERKATELELSDLDKDKRTAVVAHCVYDNVDRAKDISRKGMFNKSWTETKASDLRFDIDHDKKQQPGKVVSTFENEKKAFSKVSFGNHTLGNDTMIMMDEGIIRGASFEFITQRKAMIVVKGEKVRELKEVRHLATTVTLALPPVNPEAGVISVTKAGELLESAEFKTLSASEFDVLKQIANNDQQGLELLIRLSGSIDKSSDIYNWVLYQISRRADFSDSIRSQIKYNSGEMKAMAEHLQKMESFCRNTTASDDCIASVNRRIDETKAILSQYDTEFTRLISAPDSSRNDNDTFRKNLLLTQILSKHGKN